MTWLGRLLVAGSVLFATPVLAQDAETETADAEARARFNAGQIAYDAARYEEALADFQRAYELSGRSELLYNIALSAERVRQDELAIESFERFLELVPDHENAAQVRTRLARLRRLQTETAEEEPLGVAEEDAAPSSSPGPWVLGIGGGALLVGGGVLLAMALADKNEIEGLTSPRPWPEIESQADTVPRRSGAGIGMVAVGGVAVLGAVLWRVLAPDAPVEVSALRDGLQLRGAF